MQLLDLLALLQADRKSGIEEVSPPPRGEGAGAWLATATSAGGRLEGACPVVR
jgi:hypothetical protein